MVPLEFSFDRKRLQAPGYRDPEHSPFVVTTQTAHVLDLIQIRLIGNPIRNYIEEFTLPLLGNAYNAGIILFDDMALRIQDFDPEHEEAARYSFAIMANMPDSTKHPLFGHIFSRGGTLRAPATYPEYTERLSMIERHMRLLARGELDYTRLGIIGTDEFRTWAYFDTARFLPLQLPDNERVSAQMEREKLESFLGDTKVDL